MVFIITKPLTQHVEEAVVVINQLACDKIVASYPIYKQLNIARTAQAYDMYVWIDRIRVASNNACEASQQVSSVAELRAIETVYTEQLALLWEKGFDDKWHDAGN